MGEKDLIIVGIVIGMVVMIVEVFLVEIGMGIVMVVIVIVEVYIVEIVMMIVYLEIVIVMMIIVGVIVMEIKIEGVMLMNKIGMFGVMVIVGVIRDGIIMKKCQNQV